jgi:DNA-directed RNA polymerase specialized sigma subunit
MSRPTTDLKDYELSLRRTLVPVIVGLVLAQAARANMTLPAEHVQGVVEAVFIMGYYALVRAVERYVPEAGVLLGAFIQPRYTADE